MRIAITVDPYIPVPPVGYGGIERTVDFVCRGLTARGHQITLFAHPKSSTTVELVAYGIPPHRGVVARAGELWQLGAGLFARRKEFEVVISWGRLAALIPILALHRLPKIQRYCRGSVPWTSVRIATALAGESIEFVGASTSVYKEGDEPPTGSWRTIFDGVELERYSFVPAVSPDAPLAFLGRLCPVKGPHVAIAVAKATGRQLILAGNREPDADDPTYFEREVEPHIDGEQIHYVGTVNDEQKNSLLGKSTALVFPTAFKEAFGIVMAEAFACGTPVLASPRGSVPEVVHEGKTGFICATLKDFVTAVDKISTLDRRIIREECERRFSAQVIVDQFEQLCVEMRQRSQR
jgi:glycosyltransferase involved in cell wall biosynthesis